MQLKLLYAKEYIERVLFIVEYDNSMIFCYRSSGCSGTGHKDEILPFSSLNTHNGFRGPMVGYIYKEMFYNGRWTTHNKEIGKFENLKENMDILKEFLKDVKPEKEVDLDDFFEDGSNDVSKWLDYVVSINKEMDEVVGEKRMYDLARLIVV